MNQNVLEGFNASEGSSWSYDAQTGSLSVSALPASDIYIDPLCNNPDSMAKARHDAVTLMSPCPPGDFQFSATVEVDFRDTFDAGVLLLRANEKTWAKLCYEISPDGEPMVVSVVNKGGTSDDANAFVVTGSQVALRISRRDNVYAFHASLGSGKWIFIRAFSFDETLYDNPEEMTAGFEAQSPNGMGCVVKFKDISFSNTTLNLLRDGN
ncbi:DUF1349 domain-containing protein [Klebsiella pneumoniae]|uniref:DUF1349 domain-containing protein n=1 Tax=Klebsiella pneumoniae TaxID=573 RepID=UPI001034CE31|nr:DUF1349 domain-containing protein [Klebsiella pneumoniae]